jgi:uncharacterized protein
MFRRLHAIDEDNTELAADNEQVRPFGIINVDAGGNVSTFSPELLGLTDQSGQPFTVGNLINDSIDDILSSPSLLDLTRRVNDGVNNCRRSCEYFDLCGGGAPSNKFFETGSFESTETLYCRLTQKAVADVVIDIIKTFQPAGSEAPG